MKYLFILIIVICNTAYINSQTLVGRYCYHDIFCDVCLDFNSNTKEFSCTHVTDASCYGCKGHYKYKKGKLILYFTESFVPGGCSGKNERKWARKQKIKMNDFDGYKLMYPLSKKSFKMTLIKE